MATEEKKDNLQEAEGQNETLQNIEGLTQESELTKQEAEAQSEEADSAAEREEKSSEEAPVEIPVKDYGTMDLEALAAEAAYLVKTYPVQMLKDPIEEIKKAFFHLIHIDKKEKEAAFLADGGNIIDFKYYNATKSGFNATLDKYKEQRDAYYSALETRLQNNLQERQELIEELKSLLDKEENMSDTLKDFHHIQDRWKACGPIPKTQSSDIWRTYHHHVERFYDYLKLNREFRDMEFKHNLEKKQKLVERAEGLAQETSIKTAFEELQLLHRIWKEETGPVSREHREEIWNRFSAATKVIHERRHDFYKEQKSAQNDNLLKKQEICDKIEEIAQMEVSGHGAWQERIEAVEALKTEFKNVGRVPKSKNDEIWERFKDVTRAFNRKKNDFYKSLKKDQQSNLNRKMELVELAESLQDSEDWKGTMEVMKRIQADWKKIGHVPKQKSDEIWNRFRKACNHFFDRLSAHRNEADQELTGNLAKKEAVLAELAAYELTKSPEESVVELKEFINKWKACGPVPKNARNIENKFNKELDAKFDQLKLDKNESAMIKFRNRVENITAQGDQNKYYQEVDFVRRKIDEINKDVQQLENNIAFFSNADESNPLVREVRKNIEKQKANLSLWKSKLAVLRENRI